MSDNDGWDIVGEYADTVASMTTDISALRTQLNEARADLENERAMRAGEYDDTHSRIEKLHAELVEARAELAKAEAERDQREAECQRWAKGNADLARIISASEPNSSYDGDEGSKRPLRLLGPSDAVLQPPARLRLYGRRARRERAVPRMRHGQPGASLELYAARRGRGGAEAITVQRRGHAESE